MRAIPAIAAHVRTRLARQISDANVGPAGYIPLVTLSPEWEAAFAEALVGPAEDRQLAMAPSRLQEFMQRFRAIFDAAAATGEAPVLLTSGGIRAARARDRRAPPARDARPGAGRDLPPRPDPHRGRDLIRRAPVASAPPTGAAPRATSDRTGSFGRMKLLKSGSPRAAAAGPA